MNTSEYDRGWETEWDDMKRYGPFSRHLRRLIADLIHPLVFETILDVGCGQGSLLREIKSKFPRVKTAGMDISPAAIDLARTRVPEGEFHVGDLLRQPLSKKFDLVICSEVLEHIADDLTAIRNLAEMTGKYLIASAPQGVMRAFESEMGHVRNYAYGELARKLQENGFRMTKRVEWGFPFYSPLYRNVLNLTGGKGGTGKFGPGRKLISLFLYHLFRLNSSASGDEIVILAEQGQVPAHLRNCAGSQRP